MADRIAQGAGAWEDSATGSSIIAYRCSGPIDECPPSLKAVVRKAMHLPRRFLPLTPNRPPVLTARLHSEKEETSSPCNEGM